jgi:hypothetical protein
MTLLGASAFAFAPAAVATPNAMTPEQVIRHHRYNRRGGMGAQELSPPSSYHYFVFHILAKGILKCLILYILLCTRSSLL